MAPSIPLIACDPMKRNYESLRSAALMAKDDLRSLTTVPA